MTSDGIRPSRFGEKTLKSITKIQFCVIGKDCNASWRLDMVRKVINIYKKQERAKDRTPRSLASEGTTIEPTPVCHCCQDSLKIINGLSTSPLTQFRGAAGHRLQRNKAGRFGGVDQWQIGTISSHEQADPADQVTPEKREILRRLAESSTSTTQAERTSLATLLLQYADIFTCPGDRLGCTTKLKQIIDTGTAPPIRQHLRRVPPAHREVVKELLDQMKRNDDI
ncbi:hypothetical protein EMCRGX_G021354 [Ephydatia muelleri]